MSLTLRSLLSLIAAGGTLCYALAYNVSGVVVDSEGDICPGATVRLLRQKDSVAVKSAIAGSNGRFSITDAARGHYILETSYIGSRTDYRNISISGSNINADTIVLAENALMLGEAVVTGVRSSERQSSDAVTPPHTANRMQSHSSKLNIKALSTLKMSFPTIPRNVCATVCTTARPFNIM